MDNGEIDVVPVPMSYEGQDEESVKTQEDESSVDSQDSQEKPKKVTTLSIILNGKVFHFTKKFF